MALILDKTFNNGGIAAISFGPWNIAHGVALTKKQEIVAAGYSGGLLLPADFALAQYHPTGSLDTAFGTGGQGYVDTDFSNDSNDVGNAVVIDGNARIIVGGSSASLSWDFAIARYSPGGQVDPTFGTNGNGLVTTHFGAAGDPSEIHGLALQKDGKIVAAGYVYSMAEKLNKFALARYDKSGKLDHTFGTQGRVVFDFMPGADAKAFGVAIQSNGRIIVVGELIIATHNYYIGMAAFDPTGKLDHTFGTGGVVTTYLASGASGRAIAIGPRDNITVSGWAATKSTTFMLAVRYSPKGNKTWVASSPGFFPGGAEANAVAVLANGDVVIGGKVYPPGSQWYQLAVTAIHANGKVDTNTGMGGTLFTPLGQYSQIYSLAVTADQKVVAAGFSDTTGFTPTADIRFVVARYV